MKILSHPKFIRSIGLIATITAALLFFTQDKIPDQIPFQNIFKCPQQFYLMLYIPSITATLFGEILLFLRKKGLSRKTKAHNELL